MRDRPKKEIITDINPDMVFWFVVVLLLIPLLVAGLL